MDAAAGVTDLPKRTAADPSLRCGRVAVINSGTYPALQGAPLNIIRTETVLSTLPVHNLAKKGTIKIHIEQKNPQGEVKLLWEVSPSRDYGEPRQLAYKLDTTVINRRLDAAGRPLPGIIRL